MVKKKTLLLNYVYYNPVGHVVEALKLTKGIHEGNKEKNIEIHLILNKKTAYELTEACDWIKKTYTMDLEEVWKKGKKASCLKRIPRRWDYVINNNLIILETEDVKKIGRDKEKQKFVEMGKDEKEMINYYKISKEIFKGRVEGNLHPGWKMPKGLGYKKTKIEFKLPRESKEYVKNNYPKEKNAERICIMLAGSSIPAEYPSMKSWRKIITAIKKNFPKSEIYLTGIRKVPEGRTATWAYTTNEVNNLIKNFDNVKDAYDIGLWNQLALIESCDVFISPHTGFAFLAPCVGTPWLEIAGSNWAAYFYNKVSFYSVMPNNKNYPYEGGADEDIVEGHVRGMNPKLLDKKIPEIINGLKLLLDKKFTYQKAEEKHMNNLKKANIKHERMLKAPLEKF